VLAASVGSFSPTVGFQYLLIVFAAAVVGGIGHPYGAMLGALLIGVATEISALYVASDYKVVVAFAFLIVTLLVRPSGLVHAVRGRGLAQ
jgi:branched-subunit amino acid ABC-type transport system permease component